MKDSIEKKGDFMLRSMATPSKNRDFAHECDCVDNHLVLLSGDLTKNTIEEAERERLINEKKTYVFTSNDCAMVTDGDFSLADLIGKFDAGYRTISVVDKDKRFEGAITLRSFIEDFISMSIPTKIRFFKNLCLQSASREDLLHKAAEGCVDYCVEEIPVINGRTVVSSAIGTGLPVEGVGHRQVHEIQPARWDLILENVAKPFFSDKRKILISSEEGFLKGFKEVFQEWFEVTVYNDYQLEENLSEKYDILIFDADVWGGESINKIHAHQLYGDLLAESVARYLLGQGVRCYYLCYRDLPIDFDRRIVPWDHGLQARITFREASENYFIQSGHKNQDTHSGRRLSVGSLSDVHHNIYLFGPCIAYGTFALSFEGTIASELQGLINEDNKPYQVINCGSTSVISNLFADINHLYHIMDTPFRSGDIVFFVARSFFRKELFSCASRNVYRVNTPFNKTHRDFKGFFDPNIAHMSKDGYKIVAEYIFSVISNTLSTKVNQQSNVKSYLKRFSHESVKIQNESLQSYLEKLKPVFESDTNIGAMVIKTNELKQHPQILQEALRIAEYLYVFLKDLSMADYSKFVDSLSINTEYHFAHRVNFLMADSCIRDEYCSGGPPPLFGKRNETLVPVDDAYIFARYVAPKLHIKTYFARQYSADSLDYQYDMLIRDFLLNEGLKFVFLA